MGWAYLNRYTYYSRLNRDLVSLISEITLNNWIFILFNHYIPISSLNYTGYVYTVEQTYLFCHIVFIMRLAAFKSLGLLLLNGFRRILDFLSSSSYITGTVCYSRRWDASEHHICCSNSTINNRRHYINSKIHFTLRDDVNLLKINWNMPRLLV